MRKDRNYVHSMDAGETFKKPSLTVPNQSLSLSQMVKRHATGQSVKVLPGYYDEGPLAKQLVEKYGDITKLSKVEQAMLAHNLKVENYYKEQNAKETQKQIDEKIKLAKEAKMAAYEQTKKEFKEQFEKDKKEDVEKP